MADITGRTLAFIALVLALVPLGMTLVVRRRQAQPAGTKTRLDSSLFIPAAIIVGVLPGVLNVGSTSLRITASVVSIILSVTAIALRARAARPRS
jgi:hypothetical protein